MRFMAKKIGPKSYDHMKKEPDLSFFHQNEIQELLMKIDKMADVLLNLSNFATHAFFTLAPPSCYTLNLKTLTEVSKVS